MAKKLDKALYGESEHGNYVVIDTIGVPHPYCITERHVAYASDHCGGMLGAEAIERAERAGAKCGICKGKLKWKEHEQALLVSCKKDINGEDGKADPELRAYLLKCTPQAEADGFAGFAFKDGRHE